jgi:hypothetical protein
LSAHTPSPDVVVIGYGSLMSGFGMLDFGRLRVRAAARVALQNARRGFGKFSQHGDRFAMLLEPVRSAEPIEAHTLPADAPVTADLEGISLLVPPNDFGRLCDREGYSSGAVQRLRQEAAARRQDLAAYLWTMFADAGHDIPAFRQQLFKLVGYTSPHYIPHPIRLDGTRFAVTFLAPGREGSGSERVVPVRVRTGNDTLLTAGEAWHRKPNQSQLQYFAACMLAGMHGVCVQDLLTPLTEDLGLANRLRRTIMGEQQQELSRFLDMTGLDHATYWNAFGPPTQSVRRSGLEQFLRAASEPTTTHTGKV